MRFGPCFGFALCSHRRPGAQATALSVGDHTAVCGALVRHRLKRDHYERAIRQFHRDRAHSTATTVVVSRQACKRWAPLEAAVILANAFLQSNLRPFATLEKSGGVRTAVHVSIHGLDGTDLCHVGHRSADTIPRDGVGVSHAENHIAGVVVMHRMDLGSESRVASTDVQH